MIPKIIHYCWLSGDEFPESIKKCIASWNKYLPDYEIRLWDTTRFDIHSTKWTEQAFAAKKYAFAADYIRLYALYNYGGIYLDSDVIVYKSFNDLLHLPYFVGEDLMHCFEPAIIGAEAHQPWVKDVLDRYEGLEFINSEGNYNMRGLPVVFHDRLVPKYTFQRVQLPLTDCDFHSGIINIFPSSYFNSRDYIGSVKTKESYCSHNYIGSWLKPKNNATTSLKRYLPRPIMNCVYSLMQRLVWNKRIFFKQIPF